MGQLRDDQLRAIASDPRFTKDDYNLLSAEDQQRFQQIYREEKLGRPPQMATSHGEPQEPGRWERGAEALKNFVIGGAKGAGETALTAGRLMSKASPIASQLGNILGAGYSKARYGDEAVTPPVDVAHSFDVADEYVKPEGGMQKAGKISEQVLEYLVPAGATSRGIETAMVRGGLKLNSPRMIRSAKAVNSMAKNAVGSAAVSGMHGEAEPEHEALAGAAIAPTSAVVNSMVPILEKILPYGVGSAVGGAIGGWGGLAGGLGMGAMARNVAKLGPAERAMVEDFIRTYGPKAFQLLVGAYAESRISGQKQERGVESQLQELMR